MKMTGKLITYVVALNINGVYKIKNIITDLFYYFKTSLGFWFEDVSRLWRSVDLSNIILALEITLSSFLLCWKRGWDSLSQRTSLRKRLNNFKLEADSVRNTFDWARLRLSKGIFYDKDITITSPVAT